MISKGPYSIKLHIGEGFYNMDGEDKYYSVWGCNGNLIANHICYEDDAKAITLIPEIAKMLIQIKELNNTEINDIISPMVDKSLAGIIDFSPL